MPLETLPANREMVRSARLTSAARCDAVFGDPGAYVFGRARIKGRDKYSSASNRGNAPFSRASSTEAR